MPRGPRLPRASRRKRLLLLLASRRYPKSGRRPVGPHCARVRRGRLTACSPLEFRGRAGDSDSASGSGKGESSSSRAPLGPIRLTGGRSWSGFRSAAEKEPAEASRDAPVAQPERCPCPANRKLQPGTAYCLPRPGRAAERFLTGAEAAGLPALLPSLSCSP